jgi:hypothetical protein
MNTRTGTCIPIMNLIPGRAALLRRLDRREWVARQRSPTKFTESPHCILTRIETMNQRPSQERGQLCPRVGPAIIRADMAVRAPGDGSWVASTTFRSRLGTMNATGAGTARPRSVAMALGTSRPHPGSWRAKTSKDWTRIGAMNRWKSPSSALRAPSPPLGEKDGMRGFGSWVVALGLILGCASAVAQTQDRVKIGPLGNKVQLTLETGSPQQEYVLESQAKLMEGAEWAPLLQFRGSSAPRPFVDALCGTMEARFFRLRQLLDAPPVEVSNFRLIDTGGKAWELYYQKDPRGVALLFTGTNLVSALPLAAELDRVRQQAGASNLQIWIVTASGTSQRDANAEIAKGLPPGMPVLEDPSHAVHRTLGSGRAPEVVLISTLNWSVAYRGPVEEAIDTGVGMIRSQPFFTAAAELVLNKPISVSKLATVGTSAGLRPLAPAQYSTQIAPLLLKSCMPCHSPGDIAPWSMTNHSVIGVFSRLIKSSVLAGEMPPWHADPKHQQFENSKALAPDEVAMLVDWIDRGSPRGTGRDPLAEAVHSAPADWPLGKPDAIISIPRQSIPASGVIDYRYLYAQNPFPTDVWLRAITVKPGDRTVVHHCLVFKGGSLADLAAALGGLGGYFAGYVPGMDQTAFPAGTGKLLKRTDSIVFQMHYTVSGKPTTDLTQIGLYLAPSKPARELVTSAGFDTTFTIPPMTPEVPVSASRTFAKKSVIYELSPHMHFRGASARITLLYPDGQREVLLNVPDYFFNWQALYRLATPKEVPAGTQMFCEGTFDNSIRNRFNPDPSATVKFGEQSWEEMFIGYVNFSEVP